MNNGATAIKKTYLAMHVACLSNAHFVHSFVQEVKVPCLVRVRDFFFVLCFGFRSGCVFDFTQSTLPPQNVPIAMMAE